VFGAEDLLVDGRSHLLAVVVWQVVRRAGNPMVAQRVVDQFIGGAQIVFALDFVATVHRHEHAALTHVFLFLERPLTV
jgi:hypothetical protein